MARLNSSDLRKLLDFTAALLQCRSKTSLAQVTVQELAKLVEADGVVWNEFNHDMQMVTGAFSESVSSHSKLVELGETFQQVVHTHPAIEQGIVRFEEVASYRLSDVVAREKFRETAVYREVYQHLSFEHLMGFDCGSSLLKGLAVAFSRSEKDFGARELALLQEAAKLVCVIYKREEQWQKPPPESGLAHWNVKLDRNLIITEMSDEAHDLMETFYDIPRVRFLLPTPLHELILNRQRQHGNAPWRDVRPRAYPKGRQKILVLTSRTPSFEYHIRISAPEDTKLTLKRNEAAAKLTPRQLEVARLYVQGKVPKEIAALLHMKERTVHTHRQTILRRLQVSTLEEMIDKLLGL